MNTARLLFRPSSGLAASILALSTVKYRKGSHGAGHFAVPGGHLEYGESFEQCAAREALEETGLHLRDIHLAWATTAMLEGAQHVCVIFMQAGLAEEQVKPSDHTLTLVSTESKLQGGHSTQ